MFNPYFESLKRLYNSGKITESAVRSAVTRLTPDGSRTWITAEQAEEIIALRAEEQNK